MWRSSGVAPRSTTRGITNSMQRTPSATCQLRPSPTSHEPWIASGTAAPSLHRQNPAILPRLALGPMYHVPLAFHSSTSASLFW